MGLPLPNPSTLLDLMSISLTARKGHSHKEHFGGNAVAKVILSAANPLPRYAPCETTDCIAACRQPPRSQPESLGRCEAPTLRRLRSQTAVRIQGWPPGFQGRAPGDLDIPGKTGHDPRALCPDHEQARPPDRTIPAHIGSGSEGCADCVIAHPQSWPMRGQHHGHGLLCGIGSGTPRRDRRGEDRASAAYDM